MSHQLNKLLVTGATGFMGQRMIKMISTTMPNIEILAMSRTEPERNAYVYTKLAACPNLQFV